MTAREELISRITNYLGNGGFFNPEMMEHQKVRDLLIDLREALAASPPAQAQEPEALSELLELLWEMRRDREGSVNAFYAMADRAFKLADKVGAPPAQGWHAEKEK